jgi:hypothetical protein
LCANARQVRSLIWSRSSCASAAMVVKKNRPTGVVVSIFSVMLTRSAPASASRSAISIASRVDRASRERL